MSKKNLSIAFSALTLSLVPGFSFGAAKGCEGEPWLWSRDEHLPELKKRFDATNREELVRVAWRELTFSQEKPLFAPILQYLAGTEENRDLRGYFLAMGYLALKNTELPKALEAWPKREPFNGRFSLDELCALYQRAGGKLVSKGGSRGR